MDNTCISSTLKIERLNRLNLFYNLRIEVQQRKNIPTHKLCEKHRLQSINILFFSCKVIGSNASSSTTHQCLKSNQKGFLSPLLRYHNSSLCHSLLQRCTCH